MQPTLEKLSGLLAAIALVAAPLAATSAAASHGDDGTYDQPVLFVWAETDIDIVIVPPSHGQVANGNGILPQGVSSVDPCANVYMDAIRDSLQGWKTGINTFGSNDLQNHVSLNIYEVQCNGHPDPPTSVLKDPEVVVVTDETTGPVLGTAIHPLYDTCIVDNSKFFVTSFNYADMHDINVQESGHCLGLEHPKPDPNSHPAHDAMDGTYDDTVGSSNAASHLHCVSNLNVAGLENVWSWAWNERAGQTAELDTDKYDVITPPSNPYTTDCQI
jgi:hypothetical protein